MLFPDAGKDVQFASFGIDLEQADQLGPPTRQ